MKNKTKLVYGIGINDAGYVVRNFETIGYVNGKQKQKLVWFCPYYQAWKNMIMRCYSTKYQDKNSTYIGCTVSDEWLTFSKFKAWMETQDWEGLQLDKDILFEGNKVYSSKTCVFISPMVNTFTLDRGNDRGKYLIGASWDNPTNMFLARCSNPFSGKQENLGRFTTELEAHEKWKARKLELAKELAAIQTDPRVAKALIERYS